MNQEAFQAKVQQWYQEKRWLAFLPLLEYSFSEAQQLLQTSLKGTETKTTEARLVLSEELVHFALVSGIATY